MNFRLKLSILIVTTCFVVAGAIGIIAWAIAATNVGINSTISVTYTAAQNVVCEASATYQKTTDTSATAFQSGTLNFAYGSTTTSQTMTASSTAVVLNDTNTYVIFEYTFKNKNLMQDYRLRVQLTDNANCTNMTRKYYIGDLSKLSVSEKRNVIINGYDNSAISSQFFTMGYQETGRIYMLLEITLGVKANYSTSSSNSFSFALTTTDGYALNFDSNGGSVVNAKTVYSGSTYGTLPTPTRAGYTFKGWNGKNLINAADRNITFSNTYFNQFGTSYILTAGKTYTLSYDYKINSISENTVHASVGCGPYGQFTRDIASSATFPGLASGSGRVVLAFTPTEDQLADRPYLALRLARFGSLQSIDVDVSNIQVEIGETATTYEPYYVSNSAIITTDKDLTLTAVWEKN